MNWGRTFFGKHFFSAFRKYRRKIEHVEGKEGLQGGTLGGKKRSLVGQEHKRALTKFNLLDQRNGSLGAKTARRTISTLEGGMISGRKGKIKPRRTLNLRRIRS